MTGGDWAVIIAAVLGGGGLGGVIVALSLARFHSLATAYIVGLVENGEYGVAIAYSSALIVVMAAIISGFQLVVGERRLRRENRVAATPADGKGAAA